MDCPVCNEPLIVLEHEGVEVDFCVSCQGVWLDATEIELLFGDAEARRAFLSAGRPADARKEKRRRCPVCRRRMTKALSSGERPVMYDRCDKGDGVWFDKGELEEILRHEAAHGAHPHVTAFLKGVFTGPNAEEGRENS